MRIMLVDLSSIVHPIWHVSGDKGDPNAVSDGSISRVRQLASRVDCTIVCCDSRKSFRKEIAPSYKANRDTKPEALYFQITRAEAILAEQFVVLEADGFEADDVIASCVRQLSTVEDIEEILVASSDKDLAQLVRESDEDGRFAPVRQLSLVKNEVRNAADVCRLFDVDSPARVGDWLALVGDTSDNIKGAPGIGDKKASCLLRCFGDLAGIYAAVAATETPDDWAAFFWASPERKKLVGGQAVFASLKASGAVVALARKLVTLRDDVPLPPADALIAPPRTSEPVPDVNAANDPCAEFDEPATSEVREVETVVFVPLPLPPPPPPVAAPEPPQSSKQAPAAALDEKPTQSAQQTSNGIEVHVTQQVNPQTGEVREVETVVQTAAPPPPPAPAPKEKELDKLLAKPATATFERQLEPTNSSSAIVIAGHLFNSRLFKGFSNPDAVLGAILLGRELGLGAMSSLRGITNIEGRYGMLADLMVGLCIKSGLCEYFEPDADESGRVLLTEEKAIYRVKRVGRRERVFEFKFAEAERAGLVKPNSNWAKWPVDMCKARCVARAARTIFPEVLFGMHCPEEFGELGEVA